MTCKIKKHKTKFKRFFASILLVSSIYVVTDFAKVYSVITYQESRQVWESSFDERLTDQRKQLKFYFSNKLSHFREQFVNYQLNTVRRIKNLESDLEDLENEFNELKQDNES